MLQTQYYYNLIDAIVYLVAAIIPAYFILKSRKSIINNNDNNNNTSADFLHSMIDITFVLSLVPLVIFVWLALRSKSIKALQFQISIFIAVYILGEIIESNRIAIFSVLPPDIGSQIHVGSAIF